MIYSLVLFHKLSSSLGLWDVNKPKSTSELPQKEAHFHLFPFISILMFRDLFK